MTGATGNLWPTHAEDIEQNKLKKYLYTIHF